MISVVKKKYGSFLTPAGTHKKGKGKDQKKRQQGREISLAAGND